VRNLCSLRQAAAQKKKRRQGRKRSARVHHLE
jgi:hypothetical protein